MDTRIIILKEKISIDKVKELAEHWYGTMIKGAVDVEGGRVALGGGYHIEDSELLTSTGSKFENIWGFNIIFDEEQNFLQFDSMVNIKLDFGNNSRSIENQDIINKCEEIIYNFIEI